ncbi:hypothetical protein FACS189437_10320 [Bacteroidia bacterium]|nr:hypothetical protein FACS189437_10320 [Bacteroidia bacterium]
MINYTIYLSPEAENDIYAVYDYIAYTIIAPKTAIDYRNGIYNCIRKLSTYGGSIAINQREYLRKKYGSKVRTIDYKKMTIVFNVMNDIILIRRVIASSSVL